MFVSKSVCVFPCASLNLPRLLSPRVCEASFLLALQTPIPNQKIGRSGHPGPCPLLTSSCLLPSPPSPMTGLSFIDPARCGMCLLFFSCMRSPRRSAVPTWAADMEPITRKTSSSRRVPPPLLSRLATMFRRGTCPPPPSPPLCAVVFVLDLAAFATPCVAVEQPGLPCRRFCFRPLVYVARKGISGTRTSPSQTLLRNAYEANKDRMGDTAAAPRLGFR